MSWLWFIAFAVIVLFCIAMWRSYRVVKLQQQLEAEQEAGADVAAALEWAHKDIARLKAELEQTASDCNALSRQRCGYKKRLEQIADLATDEASDE